MFESVKMPQLPGVDLSNIDEYLLDPNVDRKILMDMFVMQVNGNLITVAKAYNMEQKMRLSKKRFPFPMKLYCNLKENMLIMGTDDPDFPEKKIDFNEKTARFFFPFKIIMKLVDEPTWCTVKIIDLEKSIYRFSNKKEFKYGY